MIEDCIAIVMAGGQSQRMGSDKAELLIGDKTLLQRVTDIMQQVFPQVLVSVRQPCAKISLPQVCDAYPDAGPLAGLCAGLTHATQANTPWVFAVATDMPFVKPAMIEYLAQRRSGYQAVVPVAQGNPQPLAAFYSASCLEPIQTILLGNGKRSLRAAIEQLKVCYVDESELLGSDDDLRSFMDIDTPQDLIAAIKHEEFG